MPDIAFTIPHALSPEEAAGRLRILVGNLKSQSPHLESASLSWDSATVCRIEGEGFAGTLSVQPSAVEARIRLEGLMAMFRPMVEEKLRDMLSKALA